MPMTEFARLAMVVALVIAKTVPGHAGFAKIPHLAFFPLIHAATEDRYPKNLRALIIRETSGGTILSHVGSPARIFASTSDGKIFRYSRRKSAISSMKPFSIRY